MSSLSRQARTDDDGDAVHAGEVDIHPDQVRLFPPRQGSSNGRLTKDPRLDDIRRGNPRSRIGFLYRDRVPGRGVRAGDHLGHR
ncbi:MAG: hypothetical protein WCJ64_17195, partial [Rhodospirillaceae bacterium]